MKVTANGITLVRIALVPAPAAMLMTAEPAWVGVAFLIAAFLGATDAVDGYLARRDGVTVLGTLLDPLADKLFTAAFLLPIVALGHSPAWAVAAVFAREFLITGLRSSMAMHESRLKTSQLGKLKTIVQMGGLAVYALVVFAPPAWRTPLHVIGLVGLLVTGALLSRRTTPRPTWPWVALVMWGSVFIAGQRWPPVDAAGVVFAWMVLITWWSGADYMLGSARTFRALGLTRGDGLRLAWALTHGILPALIVGLWPALLVPAVLGLCANLALGGIDNIVSAETRRGLGRVFWPANLAAWTFAILAWRDAAWGVPSSPGDVLWAAAWAYVAISAACAGVAFLAHRSLFLPVPRVGAAEGRHS